MRAGRALVRAGTALSVLSLGLVVDNARRIRVPSLDVPSPTEPVAVLLPVRDEVERVEACVASILRAVDHYAGDVDVVVLDDGSTDGTADVVRRIAETDPRVRLVRGTPPPHGWLGKPWACHRLAASADPAAGVLVFVDADVVLEPACLVATVDLLRAAGLDLVCPYPRQLAVTAAERVVQPLLQWSWLSTLPLGLAERTSRPSMGAANGQLLCVDTATYHRAGGHGAVRGAVLDDVELLRAVKAAGGHGTVTEGSRVATCRMYDGWGELRDGYGKSLWAAFGSPAGAAAVTGVLSLAYVVPPLAALRGSRTGLLGFAAAVAGRALAARRTGGRPLDAVLHPISVLVLDVLVADSYRRRRAGTLRWKGRPIDGGAR